MKLKSLFYALLLCLGCCLIGNDETRQEIIRERLSLIFRTQTELQGPSRLEKAIAWQQTTDFSDQEITEAVLYYLDLIFGENASKEKISLADDMIGGGAIHFLEKFNPGKEKTRKLLQQLITENPRGTSGWTAFSLYLKIFNDELLDDPFIEKNMTGGRTAAFFRPYSIYEKLSERYEKSMDKNEKNKIVQRFDHWIDYLNGRSGFIYFDEFLVNHKAEYKVSEKRKERLTNYMKSLIEEKIETDTPAYQYTKEALNNFGK